MAVKGGIGKELARINLPLSIFTEWYWEIDLNNLLRFLSLRMDKHAQKEIRDYADAMYELISPLAPWSFEAFNDFSEYRGAIKLSRLEVEALSAWVTRARQLTPALVLGNMADNEAATKREVEEWCETQKRLGF